MSKKEDSARETPPAVEGDIWAFMAANPSEEWPPKESFDALTSLVWRRAWYELKKKAWTNVQDAHDAAAEAVVKIYMARKGVRKDDSPKGFRGYVQKIAKHQAINEIIKREGKPDKRDAETKDNPDKQRAKENRMKIVNAISIEGIPFKSSEDSDSQRNPYDWLTTVSRPAADSDCEDEVSHWLFKFERTAELIGLVNQVLAEITEDLKGEKLVTFNFIRNECLLSEDLQSVEDLPERHLQETVDELEEIIDRLARFISELGGKRVSRGLCKSYAISAGITYDAAKKRVRDLKNWLEDNDLLQLLRKAASSFYLLLISGLQTIIVK